MNAKERQTLQQMYQALERLPGEIQRETHERNAYVMPETRAMVARGADRARVLVYTWLREAGMLPHGGR